MQHSDYRPMRKLNTPISWTHRNNEVNQVYTDRPNHSIGYADQTIKGGNCAMHALKLEVARFPTSRYIHSQVFDDNKFELFRAFGRNSDIHIRFTVGYMCGLHVKHV